MNIALRQVLLGLGVATLLATAACSGAEGRKARYMARGDEYVAAQNYEKARIEYANALQVDPKDAKARFAAGQVAEKLGKARDALGNYQVAVETDAEFLPARAALARLYLLGGVPDKALELVEPALVKNPEDPQLRTVRGAVRAQKGDKEGALADAEAAVATAPGDEYALALMASLYRREGRSADAIKALSTGVEKSPKSQDLRIILAELLMNEDRRPEAETQLRALIDQDRSNLANWQRLARFHLMAKDQAAAEQDIRDAIKAVPGSVETKFALLEMLSSQHGAEAAEKQVVEFLKADPKNPELKMALGRFYESAGKQDKALATYNEVIAEEKLKPKGLEARDRLAALALQRNDLEQAQKLIGEVLAENPRDNEALSLRGSMALARGDASSAITDLRSVLRDQPNSAPVVRALSRAHLQNNDQALAEEVLRSATQANPGDTSLRMDLAALLANTGKMGPARDLLELLARESPTNLAARENLFRVVMSQKDYAAARQTAEDVRRLRPDLSMGDMFAAMVDEVEGKFDAAQANYTAAQKKKPEALEPLMALIRLDMGRKQPKQALARIDATIASYPDSAVAYNLKGELLMSQKQLPESLQAFDTAIAKQPKLWVAYRGKALALAGSGQRDAAIETMAKGVEATGGQPELASDLATTYQSLGRLDDAIGVYEGMLKRDARSNFAANNLAMLLVNQRKDAASLERAAKLVEPFSGSSNAGLMDTRGWVTFKRGDVRGALQILQQAVARAPTNAEIQYHYGVVQQASGDAAGARTSLEIALKSGNAFPGSEDAKAVLAALTATK